MSERFQIAKNLKIDFNTRVDLVQDQLTARYFISKQIVKDASGLMLHQFKTEIDVLSHIHDPYIPELIDVYENDHTLTLIETYIDGQHLDEWLCNKRHVRQYRKRIYLELIRELEQVHRIGYLYIDIKPTNILIKDNHAYLIDFDSCVEKESKQIVSASSFNALSLQHICDPTVDIYALGKVLQLLYPWDVWKRCLILCCKKQKIASLKNLRFWFRVSSWMKTICLCVCVGILSVFFSYHTLSYRDQALYQYLSHPDPKSFITAYQYTYAQWHQSSYDTMYQWIDHDWIEENIYANDSSAVFLMKQAIQSSNVDICMYVMKNIPASIKQKHMDLYLQMKQMNPKDLHYTKVWVHSYIQWYEQYAHDSIHLQELLEELIHTQSSISKKDVQTLMRLYDTNTTTRKQDGLLLEYILFVKGYLQMDIQISETFLHRHSDSEWTKLVKIWREL